VRVNRNIKIKNKKVLSEKEERRKRYYKKKFKKHRNAKFRGQN